jgi:hypothetical protein
MAKKVTKVYKRDSDEIDKLIAQVEKLKKEKKMSVNAACKQVGLQTTVYYFRKRKEDALKKLEEAPTAPPSRASLMVSKDQPPPLPADIQALKDEYIQTQERLRNIESRIAEITINNLRIDKI